MIQRLSLFILIIISCASYAQNLEANVESAVQSIEGISPLTDIEGIVAEAVEFDITKGYYGRTYTKGDRSYYALYRFGNYSWSGGKTWFWGWYVNYDPTRSGIKTSDFSYYGYWEKKGDVIEAVHWEVGRNQPMMNPYKFKIDGNNIRLIQALTGSGRPYDTDELYQYYENPPEDWPFVDTQKVKFKEKFAPRN